MRLFQLRESRRNLGCATRCFVLTNIRQKLSKARASACKQAELQAQIATALPPRPPIARQLQVQGFDDTMLTLFVSAELRKAIHDGYLIFKSSTMVSESQKLLSNHAYL